LKNEKEPLKREGVRTLRGRIKQLGGINFLNFKGELKEFPTAVKRLSNKRGIPIDLVEKQLQDEGWIRPEESLLEIFRDKNILRRGRQDQIESFSKPVNEMTDLDKRIRSEMEWEPDSPPEGEYSVLKAKDLPIGGQMTIIENKSRDGWDRYRVIDKDETGVTLKDGVTIKVKPDADIEVFSDDLEKVGMAGAEVLEKRISYDNIKKMTNFFNIEGGRKKKLIDLFETYPMKIDHYKQIEFVASLLETETVKVKKVDKYANSKTDGLLKVTIGNVNIIFYAGTK